MFVYLFRSCSSFLLICLFVYFVIVPCLLPRYLTMSLRYCIYRLFVCLFLCCFSSLLMCSFYVSAVVLLLSCYSLVRLFFRVYLISFFLGDLGHSFVDLRSVSSRGVFLAGYGVPLAVRVAYVFVANVRVGCGKICMLFNAWRWR